MSSLRIALTSCCKFRQVGGRNAWASLVLERPQPDWLLMLGDNVYSTWWRQRRLAAGRTTPQAVLAPEYARLLQDPNLRRLLDPEAGGRTRLLATWDDHDFGGDDLNGAELPHRAYRDATRRVFLEYLAGALQPREEVYCSHALSGELRIILTDGRYYRTSPNVSGATLLGTTQEEWLLGELARPERIKILGSGSCLGFATGKAYRQGWNLYQRWFRVFREAVCRHHAEGRRLLFVSGDLHQNRFVDHSHSGAEAPILEAISSGAGRREHNLIPWSTPLGNYGLVDVGDSQLELRFRGSLARDRREVRVKVDSWRPDSDAAG